MNKIFQALLVALLVCLSSTPVLAAMTHEQADPLIAAVQNKDASALETLKKAAKGGDAVAQYAMGKLYYVGKGGVPKDYAQAFYWNNLAAEQGNIRAQTNLGIQYKNGDGTPKNLEKGVYWIRKAAEQGQPVAQAKLGDSYYYGDGATQDYAQAASWYQKSAAQGNAQAQDTLGVMYENGRGVENDREKAAELYKKAAEQGNVDGQNHLSVYYMNSQDYEKALMWANKAADQGNAAAQNTLGAIYKDGLGKAKQSFTEAVNWFRKAAAQNLPEGQHNLGMMYSDGLGVPKLKEASYALFELAKENSDGKIDAQNYLMYDPKNYMNETELAAASQLMIDMKKPDNFLKALDAYVAKASKGKPDLNPV